MSNAAPLADLVELLGLERIEDTLFRGRSEDLGWGALYGGQVLGQALSAAEQTVPEDRAVHSLHAYFLRKGDPARPVVYDVDCIRDGRSFTTRRVVAIQHGKAILNAACSFQTEEAGFDHQDANPEAEGPAGVESETELYRRYADLIPEGPLKTRALSDKPIEIRPIDPVNPLNPGKTEPVRKVWFRATAPLGADARVHRQLLTWASDSHFLTTAMQPHGVSWVTRGMQTASLDHTMYFHRPFRMDEWLLYVSPPRTHPGKGAPSS
jgi:acyl-CoA thioesterase II